MASDDTGQKGAAGKRRPRGEPECRCSEEEGTLRREVGNKGLFCLIGWFFMVCYHEHCGSVSGIRKVRRGVHFFVVVVI